MCCIQNACLIYSKETNHTDVTKLPTCSLYRLALITPANAKQFFSFMTDFYKEWKVK